MTSDLKEKQGLPPWLINLEEMLEDNLTYKEIKPWYEYREIIESRLAKKKELQIEDYKHAVAEQRLGRCLESLEEHIENKWQATESIRLIQALHHKKVPRDHHLWYSKIEACQEALAKAKANPFNFYSLSAASGIRAAMYSIDYTAESALCAAKCYALTGWSEISVKAREKVAWIAEREMLVQVLKSGLNIK